MPVPPWSESSWSRVCETCFGGDESKMLIHAVAYLQADGGSLPSALHLGREFRDIVGARNRTQFWTTARDMLRHRASGSKFLNWNGAPKPAPVMVLGRLEGEQGGHERAPTRLAAVACQSFTSGAVGSVTAALHKSIDREDRGGIVLRLRVDDQGCAFLPLAVTTADGVDLHLAGEAEAEALLIALELLLKHGGASLKSRAMNEASIEVYGEDS